MEDRHRRAMCERRNRRWGIGMDRSGCRRSATFGKNLVAVPDAPFNVIRVREDIAYGQRVEAFVVERWHSGNWEEIASGTSIGPRRLIRLERPVTAEKLRVRATASAAPPVI